MSAPPCLRPFALLALILSACSSGPSSPITPTPDAGTTPHDASVKKDGDHADARAADAAPDVFVPNRAAGVRKPMSADCDPVDPIRCLLPWPSNTFTVVAPSTATGLQLSVSSTGIGPTDDATSINRADGFSRVTSIETAFEGTLDPTTFGDLTTGGIRLIVEQPGPTLGQVVPVRFGMTTNGDMTNPESLLVAYPRVPLAPATDYAVVVMNSVKTMAGTPLAPDRNGQVALGLAPPKTEYEGQLYAYDAPVRAAMKGAGISVNDAVRIWDFTTRSLSQPGTDLLAMRAAELAAFDAMPVADAGGVASLADAAVPWDGSVSPNPPQSVGYVIDSVSTAADGTVAVAVVGRLTGIPYYLTASGALSRASDGTPLAVGVHDVPFRAAIPAGTGNYHIVMYGHGLGGTFDETSFDQEITGAGAVKIGTPFIGFTASSTLDTFALLNQFLIGANIASAGLTQSLADTMVVQHALGSSLGALLGAPALAGATNPAAGRFPSTAQPVWAGGSLGGTMGFVYSAVEPTIGAAVLNVPGAAWTQFVTGSTFFDYITIIMHAHYPTDLDQWLAVATGQTDFDGVDGATWYDAVGAHHPVLLEQESIGDPVLPNIGNEMVAAASHADQVGVVLSPIVTCPNVQEATSHSGMTQFKVPASVTQPLQIHGFAAGTTIAGVAAQQQIEAFIESVWAGSPTITIPPNCASNTPANSCDFTASP